MAQQQIKGATGDLGSGGQLDTYQVPGAVTVTPYSASVTFDGSGAAGAFIPCLTFKTQTGAIIARCPAPEVAAGDTGEVSWFPHVAAPDTGAIKYDQPNTDPQGAAGYLKLDTGFFDIGRIIEADWVVYAIDYQWNSSGGSGFDFEANGGDFQINVLVDGGGGHGVFTLTAEKSITFSSNGFEIQLSANGIQLAGLPTVNPGGSGLLWNNSGVVNIT